MAGERLVADFKKAQAKMPRHYRAALEIGREASKVCIQIVGRVYPSPTDPIETAIKDRLVRIRRLCDLIEDDLEKEKG